MLRRCKADQFPIAFRDNRTVHLPERVVVSSGTVVLVQRRVNLLSGEPEPELIPNHAVDPVRRE